MQVDESKWSREVFEVIGKMSVYVDRSWGQSSYHPFQVYWRAVAQVEIRSRKRAFNYRLRGPDSNIIVMVESPWQSWILVLLVFEFRSTRVIWRI